MIELIFVIVILGILASVAIPRLNATKDDAIQTRMIADTKTCISDITTTYTSQGIEPVIADLTSCANAIVAGASISYNDTNITVSGTGVSSIDGEHIFKGTSVKYL